MRDSEMLLRRYLRAVQATPPKVASRPTGMVLEGYWLEEGLYYFLAERMEASLGRIIGIPSIADVGRKSVDEVISPELLRVLLAQKTGRPFDLDDISRARFDMRDRDTLAVSIGGHEFLINRRQPRVLEQKAALSFAALYSPDGCHASFIRDHDVWLFDRQSGCERRLTTDGAAHCRYAQESEAGLAAIPNRIRPTPVGLWSPDSQWFLTHRIDDRPLPDSMVTEHAPPGGGRPVFHAVKIFTPEDEPPMATYVAIHVPSGRVVPFEGVSSPVPNYSPFLFRMAWFGGGDHAWFIRRDRYCKQAELIRLDLLEGVARIVLTEVAASGYLDLHPIMVATPNVRTLAQSDEVIWFSERDGWGHLYLYDARTGALKNRITQGAWLVRDIVHVDEERRKILFLAGGLDPDADPAQRSLCVVNLDGSGFELLLSHHGDVHVPLSEPCGLEQDAPYRPTAARAGISPKGRFAVTRYTSLDQGNQTVIADLDTRVSFSLAAAAPDPHEPPTRQFEALAADGITRLHGVLFLPPNFDETLRYPLIDYIYPGPQVAHQPQSFHSMNAALAGALAELGFITLMLNSRGLPIASRAFHQAGYPALQQPQLADHVAVINQLCERFRFVDGHRVGMVGYSAGGGATLRALCEYPELFKVGVAVCPYDDVRMCPAGWADKYRGPEVLAKSVEGRTSARAFGLEGKLLLIAGDLDENVPMAQTLAIADALIRANRDFDLLIVPNEAHELLLTNGYVQRRVWDYFVRHLLGEEPPAQFEITFQPAELALFVKRWLREFRQ
jgi:fermentation-respiration switch protein FrsA (DUF1100 family)